MRFPLRRCLLSLVLIAGCSDGSGLSGRATAPLEPTTRDSAGVTVHEHPADALERAPLITIDSVPLAVFAGDVEDPDNDISTVLSFTIRALPNGDLVGFDRQATQLVFFRTDDGSTHRVGRKGAGPGEIAGAGRLISLPGDSIFFLDSQNDRLAIVHPDSGVVRTIALAEAKGVRGGGVIGRLGDGTYLTSSGIQMIEVRDGRIQPAEDGPFNGPRHLGLWREGEDSLRRVFEVPGGWMIREVTMRGERTFSATGYDMPLTSYATIEQWGDGFLVARAERWELERRDTTGQLRALIRITADPVPVTPELLDRYADADVAQTMTYGGDLDPDSLRSAVRARPHRETMAPYGTVRVTPNGTMWVFDYRFPGDTGWAATIAAPDGRLLGRIERPGTPMPIAIGDDRLAFRTEDELGIATITVRRIVFPQ